MRGCLTTIITLIILFAFGGSALAAIVILVPLLLGEQDAKSLADLHWYTWVTIIILPIILLKILVKASRITANYICDVFGID
jgi:hypothetical protein